jgi:hypothetical protein
MHTKKLVALIICIATFALMSGMFASLVEPVRATEQVAIVNHQGFLDSAGYYNVYGEVKNNGDTAAKNVYVKITFMSGSAADEDEYETLIHIILPGRKAPFMGTAGAAGSTVSSYTVELMDLTMSADDMPKVLSIMSSNAEVNIIHNMMITGKVKNTGTETATYTRVYATVYDGPSGTGNVVAVTSCTAQPYNVDPGQTGDFQMGFFVTPGKTYASYILVAESDQYAATTEYASATGQTSVAPSSSASPNPSPSVPEFPPFVAVPLLIVIMLIIALAAKRKHI